MLTHLLPLHIIPMVDLSIYSYSLTYPSLSLPSLTLGTFLREEASFCRTDVGEFSTLTKGKAVKEFELDYNRIQEGKERIIERARVQTQLRYGIKIYL